MGKIQRQVYANITTFWDTDVRYNLPWSLDNGMSGSLWEGWFSGGFMGG